MFKVLLIIIVLGAAAWLFTSYNKLRQLAEHVKRRQANIAATVKKRHDVAQKLADIAASYGEHEKLTHFTVIEGEASMAEASAVAASASRVIGHVQTLANRFPDLKASGAYQQLMHQLEEIENTILQRREDYNEAAQTYNSTRSSLPHLFYAGAIGFSEASYFGVDDDGTEQMAVFRTDDGALLREGLNRMAAKAGQVSQIAAAHAGAAAQQAGERFKAMQDERAAAAREATEAATTADDDDPIEGKIAPRPADATGA